MNACFTCQFGYCHLVWMNHSWTLNNRINGGVAANSGLGVQGSHRDLFAMFFHPVII